MKDLDKHLKNKHTAGVDDIPISLRLACIDSINDLVD